MVVDWSVRVLHVQTDALDVTLCSMCRHALVVRFLPLEFSAAHAGAVYAWVNMVPTI